MAGIKLASAIGQQRDNISVFGGLGDAIGKIGGNLVEAEAKKSAEAAKRKAQEQKMRDEILANVKTPPPSGDMHPDDWAEREDFAKNGYADLVIAKNSGASNAELERKQREYLQGLEQRDYVYKRDWKVANDLAKAADEGLLTTDMDMFMAGKENQQNKPSQISQSQQGGGYGVPTQEEALGSTEFTGTPYFKKPLEERLKTDIVGEFGKKAIKPVAGVKAAAKDVFSEELNPEAYVVETTNQNGGKDFAINKDKIEKDAQRYAIQMVGDTNWGKDHKQTKDAMEYQAVLALRKAGLQGEELAAEVPKVVAKMAYDEYKNMALRAVDDRLKDQKEDPLKKESKGTSIAVGGGGQNDKYNFGKPKEVNIREGATFERVKSKNPLEEDTKVPKKKGELVSYDYISMQTKVPSENPAMIVEGSEKGVHFQGVYKKKDGSDIAYFKFTENSDGTGKEILLPKDKLKGSTLSDIKTNIGEDDFEKAAAIGKYAPKASKGKQYKIADVTVDFVNKLKDGEIVVIDGIERVKQDGKLKKVKR